MGKFLKECFLQKTNQFDALDVWGKLGMGKSLSLRYDKKEINGEGLFGDKVLGVLSDEDAKSLKTYLDAGWNKTDDKPALFYGKISKFDQKADENKRLEVAIFVQSPDNIEMPAKKKKTVASSKPK